MKKIYYKLILSVLMCICYSRGVAYDFQVDGICYNLISAPLKTCMVAKGTSYSGEIHLSNSVEYNDKTLQVVGIADSAFMNCPLTYIYIPEGIKSIGVRAFQDCKNLKEIYISKGLTRIGGLAFYGSGLKKASFAEIEDWYYIDGGHNLFDYTNAILYINDIPCLKLTIPSNAKVISAQQFSGMDFLEEINISTNVSRINKHAFSGCTALKKISIPNNVTYMDVSSIGPQLDTLILEDSDTPIELGDYSGLWGRYSKTWNAKVINIQRSIKNIPLTGTSKIEETLGGLYFNCTELIIGKRIELVEGIGIKDVKSLTIEDSDKPLLLGKSSYESYTINSGWWHSFFRYAKNLTKLYCGRNLVASTYRNNKGSIDSVKIDIDLCSIKELTIGHKLSDVRLFANQKALQSITVINNVPPTTNLFSNTVYLNCNVYVPKGCRTTFEESTNWSYFWNIIESEVYVPQQIIWAPSTDTISIGDTITLSASSSSSLPVTFSITKGNENAELLFQDEQWTLIGLHEGMVEIIASQSGNETFQAAESVKFVANITNTSSSIYNNTILYSPKREYFNLSGQRVKLAKPGIYIIRMSDGTTKKVLMK